MNVNYGHPDLSRWILMDIRCLSISMSESQYAA